MKKRNKKFLWIGVFCMLVLAVLAVGVVAQRFHWKVCDLIAPDKLGLNAGLLIILAIFQINPVVSV